MPGTRIAPLFCALGMALAAVAQADAPAFPESALVTLGPESETHASALQLDALEDLPLLDETLAVVFPDGPPAERETLALEILAHVAQKLRLGQLGTRLATEAIRAGEGSCTDFAIAFAGLCRRAGLPARLVHFHNFGWMQGHSAVELHYDGRWHFMDPTFGSFFYSRPVYDRQGRILGLRELHGAPAGTVEQCHTVTTRLWAGEYTHRAAPEPAGERRAGRHKYTLLSFYTQLFRRSFPIVCSDSNQFSMVFNIDLSSGTAQVGHPDGHGSDLFEKEADGEYRRYHGFPQLGETRHFGAFHTLEFKNAEVGWYRLSYLFFGDSRYSRMGVVPLKSVLLRSAQHGENTWSVLFYLEDPEGLMIVANPGGLAYVDAVAVTGAESPPLED